MPDPVTVSVEVARPRQEVFDFVDVLANHEGWMGLLYKNWTFEGPRRGVGAIAKAQVDAPSARERVSFEVVESIAPERIVEEGESAHGKRETRSTYSFAELERGRHADRVRVRVAESAAHRTDRSLRLPRLHEPRPGQSLKKLAAQLEEG